MCKGVNTKLPDSYWIVIVHEICAETCAWNTGSMNCLLQDLDFFYLGYNFLDYNLYGYYPSFLFKIWASALLSKKALFVSVENGRHLTPSLAKISAPPSFVHQSPFSCDSCSSREICLETAPLVKSLSFVFCFFPLGCLFLHSSCWLSAEKLKWLNSILKFFPLGIKVSEPPQHISKKG